jgi:hypothetical protein
MRIEEGLGDDGADAGPDESAPCAHGKELAGDSNADAPGLLVPGNEREGHPRPLEVPPV